MFFLDVFPEIFGHAKNGIGMSRKLLILWVTVINGIDSN